MQQKIRFGLHLHLLSTTKDNKKYFKYSIDPIFRNDELVESVLAHGEGSPVVEGDLVEVNVTGISVFNLQGANVTGIAFSTTARRGVWFWRAPMSQV